MTPQIATPQKKYLTRSELLQQLMPVIHEIEVKGIWYRITELTAAAKDSFEQSIIAKDDDGNQVGSDITNVRAKLLCKTLVDEAGARMFTDDDALMLGQTVGAGAVDPIFRFAQKVNGFSRTEVADAAKKSEQTPASDLPSASV